VRLRALAGIGLVILMLSLAYLASGWAVRLVDRRIPSEVSAAPCLLPDVSVTMPKRRLSIHDSEMVSAVLSNTTTSTCVIEVSIRAPGFEVEPPGPVQSLALSANGAAEVKWIVSPLRMGTHQIMVQAGMEYRVVGVIVTNVLGLTDRQAQWVSVIGTFFGSSLTVPWLYEAWQARKREAERQAQAARIDDLEQQVAALRDARARERDRKRWWQFWR
jgi:hypothetical protein